MIHSARSPSALLAGLTVSAAVVAAAWLLTACGEETSTVAPVPMVQEYGTVDSLVFWPPTLRYARPNDSLTLRAWGIGQSYDCADKLLDGGWNSTQDTTGAYFYRIRTPLYQHADPPGCALAPTIDSLFKRVFFPNANIQPPAGTRFYLQTPGPKSTDSILLVAGTASLYAFTHVLNTDSSGSAHGPFVFDDSTAGRPRWMVRAASLATCEILQTAVFKRSGDTLRVRVRRIQATPLPESVLPACAGSHEDSVEVVPDLYRFP